MSTSIPDKPTTRLSMDPDVITVDLTEAVRNFQAMLDASEKDQENCGQPSNHNHNENENEIKNGDMHRLSTRGNGMLR